MAVFNLNVNGKKQSVDVDPRTPVLWVLRDHLNLVGTKYGCGVAQCGACTIHLGDVAVRSCQLPVSAIADKSITTIEGLAKDDQLHPVQQACLDVDVFQCSYCASGMIMSAVSLLGKKSKPTEEEIIQSMQGNICRCGTYVRIVKAIQQAAKM